MIQAQPELYVAEDPDDPSTQPSAANELPESPPRRSSTGFDWAAIEARDLRLACIHEYAHAVTARHFDARGIVGITKQPRPSLARKYYTGHFSLLATLSSRRRRLVWLAGSIAEIIDADPRVTPEGVLELFARGEVSLSRVDAEGAEGFQRHNIIECSCLVGILWPRIAALTETRVRIENGGGASEADIVASCLT